MGVLDLKPLKINKNRLRKQGFEDSFFFIAVLFGIAIIVLIVYYAWSQINAPLAESIESALPANSGVNVTANFAIVTSTINIFDKLIPLLIIGLFGFVLIGASIYMNHPLMAIVGIIILGIAVLLAVIYSNVYHQISSSDVLTDTNSQFPITELFMKYLPYLVVIIFVLMVAAVIWSRAGGASGL